MSSLRNDGPKPAHSVGSRNAFMCLSATFCKPPVNSHLSRAGWSSRQQASTLPSPTFYFCVKKLGIVRPGTHNSELLHAEVECWRGESRGLLPRAPPCAREVGIYGRFAEGR